MYQKELFPARLRKLRQDRKESQKDLAEALNFSITQISDMEKGRRTTTFEKLYMICEHFNVSADFFLGLTNDPRPVRDEGAAGALNDRGESRGTAR